MISTQLITQKKKKKKMKVQQQASFCKKIQTFPLLVSTLVLDLTS